LTINSGVTKNSMEKKRLFVNEGRPVNYGVKPQEVDLGPWHPVS